MDNQHIKERLEFEGGRLVKVDGHRPEYMDGHTLIRLVRSLAEALVEQPQSPGVTLQEVWGLLTQGAFKHLGGSPLHQAYLGASGAAMYVHAEDDLIIIDCQPEEGLSIHVYRGDLAWELPLDGSAPVAL